MGNFHCIPSSCAKVVYRQYLAPVIRWRYPNEEWQEIEADDYSVEQKEGQDPNAMYRVVTFQNVQVDQYRSHQVLGPIKGIKYRFGGTATSGSDTVNLWVAELDAGSLSNSSVSYLFYLKNTLSPPGHYDIRIVSIVRKDGKIENNCNFKIFKNGEIIYEETRDICPEVEKLDCRLSDIFQEIKIDKFPYLERVEVVPYLLTSYREKSIPAPIVQAEPIPNECLNIYLNNVLTLLPYNQDNPESYLNNNATPFNSFITQICSSPSCLPPEYQVICDCDCEQCPDGTCAKICDGSICCYDTDTGIAVKQIAIADYCGGTL